MSAAPPRGAAASERRQLCAALASASEEPLIGKAGGTRAWVLLEHPGPWPHDAPRGPLPPHLVDAIERHADAHALRVLLIRRRGRPPLDGRLQSYLAWSGCDPPWMEERTLGDYAEILEADLAALAAGRRPGFGAPVAAPSSSYAPTARRTPAAPSSGCRSRGRSPPPTAQACGSRLTSEVIASREISCACRTDFTSGT